MAISINSAGIFGIDGYKVLVECELSKGLPGIDVVGLPDASVKEANARVRATMKNYKLAYPVSKIVINLAPADVKKEGTIYDLPILMAMLCAGGEIGKIPNDCAFVGELSLNGEIRPVSGALSMAIALKEAGIKHFFVPRTNAFEASFCSGINIYPIDTFKDVLWHFDDIYSEKISPFVKPQGFENTDKIDVDFADVVGQENVKRAFEITAAGMHNILLSGSPGSGKSMMTKRLPSILPPLNEAEQMEVIRINSANGTTKNNLEKAHIRPFRAPHHTVSSIALTGGIGTNKFPKPGEISLAHNGILFLDELPEFKKDAIEAMRAPIEDKVVTISRVNTSVTYPSNFVLVGAMNPCKCGWYGDDQKECTCTEASVHRYNEKISGPMMDRIDLFVNVLAVKYNDLHERKPAESSAEILKRVMKAREIQAKRFFGLNIKHNAEITPDKMKEFCQMEDGAEAILQQAFARLNMTARSYDRILKVARTIADLDNSLLIKPEHIAEAISYRKKS